MAPVVILLRGVNVGGHARLPMGDFAAMLEDCGCRKVQTYINSGNAVALWTGPAEDLAARFRRICTQRLEIEPGTLVIPLADFRAILAANPFTEAEAAPKALHVFFCLGPPGTPDLAAMKSLCAPGEDFVLTDRALYLKVAEKLTDSALLPKITRFIKAPLTGRNWRTVAALEALAGAM